MTVKLQKALICGGAGYIGSTVASCLADNGFQFVILDDLSTGRREFVRDFPFFEGDKSDNTLVDEIFRQHPDIDIAFDFAAKIVVPDSVSDPAGYYDSNVSKSLAFVRSLLRNQCHRLVFSSSASIYAVSSDLSVDESSPVAPTSPYARSKVIFETILKDISAASDLKVISLRYFNPIGSDPKLRTGLQLPFPSHALGKLIQAYSSGVPFRVTGTDYETIDGSGLRDYINVWDLAHGHRAAVDKFDVVTRANNYQIINLGTGEGTTVYELIKAFEDVVGSTIPVQEAPRRPGDAVGAYTRSTKALDLLGWKAQLSIEDGIQSTLDWFDIRKKILKDLEK